MSRRIEITVPNEWAPPVRKILSDPDKCNFTAESGKPHMVVELVGTEKTIFLLTIPGPAVSTTLEIFRKNGIGTSIGRIILVSLDYMKPDLARPLINDPEKDAADVKKGIKPPPLKGFQHFQKARKTTEEMYNEISNNANMTVNTWMNLIGASVMAAGGLTTGVLVFIVAAMLVSPIMGPILGMTMGYRVADWPLFKTGFINEMKMALATYLIGCLFGLILGDVGNTYKWPNSQMMPEGQAFNLIISIIVSAAAGMVLGVSMTATGGNALVGTAISAGLLPPLVNAGMLMVYSAVYAEKDKRADFYEIGTYNILFYFTHVVTIVIVANTVFWLKDVDPRFREGEDSSFNDIPTLVEHKQRLAESGKEYNEREKAGFFIEHIRQDLTKDVRNIAVGIKEKAGDFANFITGKQNRRRRSSTSTLAPVEEEETINPLVSTRTARGSKYEAVRVDGDDGDVEMQHAQTKSKEELREEVTEFYRQHNPTKLSSVSDILDKYEGREEELLRKLYKQYNIPR